AAGLELTGSGLGLMRTARPGLASYAPRAVIVSAIAPPCGQGVCRQLTQATRVRLEKPAKPERPHRRPAKPRPRSLPSYRHPPPLACAERSSQAATAREA